jgi:phosphate transport system protein
VGEVRRTYHEQLDELRRDVLVLNALASEAVAAATQALLDGDLAGAEKVVADDARLDALNRSVEDRAFHILARQQPTASDLRLLVTVLRVVHELERVGDLMVNVAKSTRRLYPVEFRPRVRGILSRMGDQAAKQLRVAGESFAHGDTARAAALPDMDDVMDELQRDLFRLIFEGEGSSSGADLHAAVELALIGRWYERVADHAVNVGHRVAFLVTGVTDTEVDASLGMG